MAKRSARSLKLQLNPPEPDAEENTAMENKDSEDKEDTDTEEEAEENPELYKKFTMKKKNAHLEILSERRLKKIKQLTQANQQLEAQNAHLQNIITELKKKMVEMGGETARLRHTLEVLLADVAEAAKLARV